MEQNDLIACLINRRKELGLTQYGLAKRAGVSREAVAKLELGKHSPKFDTLLKVLNALALELAVERAAERG